MSVMCAVMRILSVCVCSGVYQSVSQPVGIAGDEFDHAAGDGTCRYRKTLFAHAVRSDWDAVRFGLEKPDGIPVGKN